MRNVNGPSLGEDGVNSNKPKSAEGLVQFYRYFIMIWCKLKYNCGDYNLWTELQKCFKAAVTYISEKVVNLYKL